MSYYSSEDTRSSTGMTYDRKTGKWVPVPSSATEPDYSGSYATQEEQEDTSSQAETADYSTSSTQVNSLASAQTTVNQQKIGTLSGDMSLSPCPETLKINQSDTIRAEGLGKYLSGVYFVKSRTLTFDSSGVTLSISLLKNGFGDSLKSPAGSSSASSGVYTQTQDSVRVEEVPKAVATVGLGDTVRIAGDDAVYSNASDGVKVPDWIKQKTLTVDCISDDGARARLKEIWSWTYIKYLQKV